MQPTTLVNESGPTVSLSKEMWTMKYSNGDENHAMGMERIAKALADNPQHENAFQTILKDMRFLPGGRVQAGAGSKRDVTLFNCFVSGKIEDSMESIMKNATDAAFTMKAGGGIGYNFSHLRPRGALIKSLDSKSSGPVSFMGIFDAVCQTIASAGHRRGAQMGVLNCDHPSILEFIHCKRNQDKLRGFNISVGVTDKFMDAVLKDEDFNLEFDGVVYETVRARKLWDEIMMATWDWAEPGILFLDRINEMNNLWWCEHIEATNPCGKPAFH
jgi:ribonucleoside-diphosphate reductase alpha chain